MDVSRPVIILLRIICTELAIRDYSEKKDRFLMMLRARFRGAGDVACRYERTEDGRNVLHRTRRHRKGREGYDMKNWSARRRGGLPCG